MNTLYRPILFTLCLLMTYTYYYTKYNMHLIQSVIKFIPLQFPILLLLTLRFWYSACYLCDILLLPPLSVIPRPYVFDDTAAATALQPLVTPR